ncbi:hypothetical protein BDZ89DRAFT_423731 [Hymenopellis radicata]|nr:hypothetical protein BDZ89DRAFT_423731 [Hymenopellis radicata]
MGQYRVACRQRDVGERGFRYKRDTSTRPRHEIPRRPRGRGVERNVRVQSRLLTGLSARLSAGPISPDADGICLPRRSLRRFHAVRRDDAAQLLKLMMLVVVAGLWTCVYCKTVPALTHHRGGVYSWFLFILTTTRSVTLVAPLMPVVLSRWRYRSPTQLCATRYISLHDAPFHFTNHHIHTYIPHTHTLPAVFTFLILQRYSSPRPASRVSDSLFVFSVSRK